MKIVIACDSFKGCLASAEVAACVERGIRRVLPDALTVRVPVADGGEGTTAALVEALGGRLVTVAAHDPLGREIEASYGLLPDGTAVVETAAASGLPLLLSGERDPLVASSRGTGELILSALEHGCRRFVIGLGGSATNDGGAGLLQALGGRLLDADGHELAAGGAALARLSAVELGGLDRRLSACEFLVACDVTNPLCGEQGASRVYGPQKGATPEMVEQLDRALAHYATLMTAATGREVADLPGSGAAGGLGAAFRWLTTARLQSGIELVLKENKLAEHLAGADLLITGEGRMDGQSRFGKAAYGVLQAGLKAGVPVAAVVGQLALTVEEARADGFTAAVSLMDEAADTADAIRRAAELLENAGARVMENNLAQRRQDAKIF